MPMVGRIYWYTDIGRKIYANLTFRANLLLKLWTYLSMLANILHKKE